jgi:tRNA(Ile)-lysidine synthase
VSGGLDSIALADYWYQRFPRSKIGWEEALFVESLCEKYSANFHYQRLDLSQKPSRSSLEAWWREERYTFFKHTAKQYGYQWILTAHHLDDQVETIWVNLFRGTGLAGLAGIHPRRNDDVLRPFLNITKSQIHEYALSQK